MHNSFAVRLLGSIGLLAATVAGVGFLIVHDDAQRLQSSASTVKRLPSIRYELRAEQTGEMFRGHRLDGDGLARQIRVQFRDGSYGIKYTTGTGVLVGAKEFLKDGSYIVYDIEPDGKTSKHQRWFSKSDVLLRERHVGAKNAVKVTVFADDGVTPKAFEESAEGNTSKVFLSTTGKPRARFNQKADGAIEFVALSEAGSQLYSENLSAQSNDCECGGSQDIEVAVYREGGGLHFKQLYHTDHTGNDPELRKVEEYSADGKQVVRSIAFEGDGKSASVTTLKDDGTKETRKIPITDVPAHLVKEPTHPAKDLEPKLTEPFDFPLRAANMLN